MSRAWCSWTVGNSAVLRLTRLRLALSSTEVVDSRKSMRQRTRRTMADGKKRAGRAMFGTRGWIVAGTLAAYAVMGGTKFVRAERAEKEKGDPPGSSTAEATLPLKKF